MVGCKMRWKKSVQNRQAPNLQCGLMQFANGGCQWPIPLSFCGPNRRNCTFLCSECCILYHPRHPTLCNTSREISHEITVDAAQCFMHFKHFNKANKSDLFKKTYCCSLDGSMAEGGCDAKTRFMMACLAADAAVAVVTPTGGGW